MVEQNVQMHDVAEYVGEQNTSTYLENLHQTELNHFTLKILQNKAHHQSDESFYTCHQSELNHFKLKIQGYYKTKHNLNTLQIQSLAISVVRLLKCTQKFHAIYVRTLVLLTSSAKVLSW